MKKIINEIEQFITNNNLNFDGAGSELNGNFTILAGFMDFKLDGKTGEEMEIIVNALPLIIGLTPTELKAFKRVFEFARNCDYKKFWHTDKAKAEYKF